jgi:hypothetical protein
MEKRSETRIERNLGIVVEVNSCNENPDLVGSSIPCEATDFSPHGLRYNSDLPLSPGSLVNITLSIEQPDSSFLLLCEVRWEFEDDGKLSKGLIFLEGDNSDLKRWVEAFDSIFKNESTS